MRIVAAGKNLAGSCKLDGQLNGARIEVDGIKVELLQIAAGPPLDILATIRKGFKTAVQPLRQIWDRTAQMAQHPADSREALRHAAEDQAGRGQGGIHK